MIQKHIQLATFRVVAYIKGDCVELPRFPRVSSVILFVGLLYFKERLGASHVLWFG